MNKNNLAIGTISALGLLLLILDAQTAIEATKDGINLCLYTVIPSLFPFLVFSYLINTALMGTCWHILRPLGKICGIPRGQESLLLLGFLGGYPVGAKNIYDVYQCGAISKQDARRLLGFCSNAGPSFIFGILGGLFTRKYILWLLWAIHIASAILVGILLPAKHTNISTSKRVKQVSIPAAVNHGVRTMSSICGWIILMRIILVFLQRRLLLIFPESFQILTAGLLELSNGCIDLYSLRNEGSRFVMAALFLGFGGLCVAMQTVTVTNELGTGMYFPGKILQSCFSVLLAGALQHFIFPMDQQCNIPVLVYIIAILIPLAILTSAAHNKKTVAILQ